MPIRTSLPTVLFLIGTIGCSSSPSPSPTEKGIDSGSPAPQGSDSGPDAIPNANDGRDAETDARSGRDAEAAVEAGRDSSPTEAGTGTALTGMLGTLGAVQPTVSSLVISNSGETLIYLSSAPLTCEQIKVSRWLGNATKASQVVEIVVKGQPKVGEVAVPPGEVNFAEGGKSSSYETTAAGGKITFTTANVSGIVEGSVTATYSGGGSVSGTFHAEFCEGGQGY